VTHLSYILYLAPVIAYSKILNSGKWHQTLLLHKDIKFLKTTQHAIQTAEAIIGSRCFFLCMLFVISF